MQSMPALTPMTNSVTSLIVLPMENTEVESRLFTLGGNRDSPVPRNFPSNDNTFWTHLSHAHLRTRNANEKICK